MKKFLIVLSILFFTLVGFFVFLFYIGIDTNDLLNPLKPAIYVKDVFQDIPESSFLYFKIIGGKNIYHILNNWKSYEIIENKSIVSMLKEAIIDYKERIYDSAGKNKFIRGVFDDLKDIFSNNFYLICGADNNKDIPWVVLISEITAKKRRKFLVYNIAAHIWKKDIRIRKISGQKVFFVNYASNLDYKVALKNNLLITFINCNENKIKEFFKVINGGTFVKTNHNFNAGKNDFYETSYKDIDFWIDVKNIGKYFNKMNEAFMKNIELYNGKNNVFENSLASYSYLKITFGNDRIHCKSFAKVNIDNEKVFKLYSDVKKNVKKNSRFLSLFDKNDTAFFYISSYYFRIVFDEVIRQQKQLSEMVKNKSLEEFEKIDFSRLREAFGDVLLVKIWDNNGNYKMAGIQKEDGDILKEISNIIASVSPDSKITKESLIDILKEYYKEEKGYIYFGIDRSAIDSLRNLFNTRGKIDYRNYINNKDSMRCVYFYRLKPQKACKKILKNIDEFLQIDPDELPENKRSFSNYLYMLDLTGALEMYFTSYIEALTHVREMYSYGTLNEDFTINSKCVIINELKKSSKN